MNIHESHGKFHVMLNAVKHLFEAQCILCAGTNRTFATEDTERTEMKNKRSCSVTSVSSVARFQPFGV